nr:histidine kinase [Streptomyces coryli]
MQALCRQIFVFRLAMIVLAAPMALEGAAPGFPTWLVAAAVLATIMISYALFRDWERFGPFLLRHPAVLAGDMMLSGLLLITATPGSTLAYVAICTPLLAGVVYGWRGAAAFAVLQGLLFVIVYASTTDLASTSSDQITFPGLCLITGAVGVALRNLVLRIGAASQALTEARARLAVGSAVEAERNRLAREMHDSVAKTLHGVALAADGLVASADRLEPEVLKGQAALVSRSARKAAAESREILADLRRQTDSEGGVQLMEELEARVADFDRRHKLSADMRPLASASTAGSSTTVPTIPYPVARQLLTIVSESMENSARHAEADAVSVSAGIVGDMLRVSVIDNGKGLPRDVDMEQLRKAGHFGLVGMVERAASIGARIRIGKGRASTGTEVRLDLPVAAVTSWPPMAYAPHSATAVPTYPQSAERRTHHAQ